MKLVPAMVALALMAAACSPEGGGGDGGNRSTDEEPASVPSEVSVDEVTYTTEVAVGGSIVVNIELSNTGTAANPGTKLQFSDIDQYADIVGCVPTCDVSEFFGDYADLPGVPAGGSAQYSVEFIATTVGAARWGLCIYDGSGGDDQIYCGNGTTIIR
ncbi:MAG: hypothetical protein WD402_03350 [Chloroflexota bacterium]